MFLVISSAHDAYEVVISEPAFINGTIARLGPLTANSIHFPKVATYDRYLDDWPGANVLESQILELQSNQSTSSQWKNLSAHACSKRYASKSYNNFSSVIVFTNWVPVNKTQNSALAMAPLSGSNYGQQKLIDLCPPEFLSSNTTFFKVPKNYTFNSPLTELCNSYKRNSSSGAVTNSGLNVTHCLSLKAHEECVIATSPLFWHIITVVLLIQAVAMLATLTFTFRTPLLVIGDVLDSYLKRPEALVHDLSACDVVYSYSNAMLKNLSVPLYLWLLVALVLGMLPSLKPGLTLPNMKYVIVKSWDGLTLIIPYSSDRLWLLKVSLTWNNLVQHALGRFELMMSKLILWTNSAQIISVIREYFENACASGAQSQRELLSYSKQRLGLRVSQPAGGHQRSTYWLSMPVKQVLLHINASAFWHWWLGVLLSVQLVYVWHLGDSSKPYPQAANRTAGVLAKAIRGLGKLDTVLLDHRDVFAVGYIPLALVLLLGLPAVLHWTMLLRLFPWKGKNDTQLGVIDSLTLSSRCHPPAEEGDISEKEVIYGLVREKEVTRPALWSFTSGDVLAHEQEAHEKGAHEQGALEDKDSSRESRESDDWSRDDDDEYGSLRGAV